jgi:excisionase family DNA binding protein
MKSPTSTDENALLDLPAAQRYLGVSRTTFYVLRQTGEIPEIQLTPRCVRFLRADLDAFIQKRRNFVNSAY